jgi:soluble lytic murein transglycosylase-like protein
MDAKQNGGGGLAVLFCLGLLFIPWKSTGLEKSKIATMRAWGLKPALPSSLLGDAIDAAADRHGIKRSTFRALVKVESGGNHRAVSIVGARGLSQVMPVNAYRCGLYPDELFDPLSNLDCGARILREEIDRVGNERDALAVYNAGKPERKAGQQYASLVLSLAKRLVG